MVIAHAFEKAAKADGKASYDLVKSGETLGTIHLREVKDEGRL